MDRQDRRKEQSRTALIRSAQRVMARGDWAGVSIKTLTDGADVGFGTFYNHFATKEHLFDDALDDASEQYGALLESHVAGIEDEAERIAVRIRLTGRMARTHPELLDVISHAGLSFLTSPSGIAPRALHNITEGVAARRLLLENPLVALAVAGGGLLGLMHLDRSMPGAVDDTSYDELAALLLRMHGFPPPVAHEIAHRPLPTAGAPVPPGVGPGDDGKRNRTSSHCGPGHVSRPSSENTSSEA